MWSGVHVRRGRGCGQECMQEGVEGVVRSACREG